MTGEGSPALERLAQAVLERGITVCPAWDGRGFRICVEPPEEKEVEENKQPEGRLGRWW